jgi:hypothetical protein
MSGGGAWGAAARRRPGRRGSAALLGRRAWGPRPTPPRPASRASRPAALAAPPRAAPQTVPSCQPLFKNTFNYHTVAVAPPEFDECFEFLGAPKGVALGGGGRTRGLVEAALTGLLCTRCRVPHSPDSKLPPRQGQRREQACARVLHDRRVEVNGPRGAVARPHRRPLGVGYPRPRATHQPHSAPRPQTPNVELFPPNPPPRAPAVVIGYLMKLRHWRLAEAYKWVKDKRPSVNISQSEGPRRRGGRGAGRGGLHMYACMGAPPAAGRPESSFGAVSTVLTPQPGPTTPRLPNPQPTPSAWWTWRCGCTTRARCLLASRPSRCQVR